MDSGCTNHMTGDKELFTEDKLTQSSQRFITFSDNNDKISYAHQYSNPSSRKYVYGALDGSPRRNTNAHNFSSGSASTSASSKSPARLWVVKKN